MEPRQSSTTGDGAQTDRDAGPLLARAHLLRMRGQWSEAAEVCTRVLAREPENATAHSLLGDIYQDEGRLEEALRWYTLARELDPSSRADRVKAARVEEMLEAREQREEWQAVVEGRVPSPADALAGREALQRVGALAGAAVCGIILVMATLVSASDRGGGAENAAAPWFNPAGRKKPVPVVLETPREQRLLTTLTRNYPQDRGQVVRLEVDPRLRTTTLRLVLPARLRDDATTPTFRERVMREGYRAAFHLQRAARELHEPADAHRLVHVQVLGPSSQSPGSSPEALLIGTLAASDLVVEPDMVTAAELLRFYQAQIPPYWSPEMATP